MKLTNEQKSLIVSLYEEKLEDSPRATSQEIADYINEELGLDCDESTFRKTYKAAQLLRLLNESDEQDHKDYLAIRTRRDLRQREERKKLVRERALVEMQVKDLADKTSVALAIERMYARPMAEVIPLKVKSFPAGVRSRVYAYGDIHWGYTIDTPTIKYNKAIAVGRLDAIYEDISQDILKKDLKEVYIADLGDDIEGAALRPSQMLRIVEAMTEQAIGYSNYLKKKLQQLAEAHPTVRIHFIHVSKDNHSELRLHGTSRDELPENLQMLICDKLNDFVETAHTFGALTNLDYTYGDEVVASINGLNVLFAHSHQYGKNDNILEKARARHEVDIHGFVGAHWHQYKHTNRDSYHGVQTSLVFINPVVGDTDYSEKLFYSSRPGYTVVYIDGSEKCITSKQVLID